MAQHSSSICKSCNSAHSDDVDGEQANKATYLFTKVPATAAEALLQLGQLYLASKDGNIPWKQFPEVLQSAEVAKIPPVSASEGN